VSSVLLLIALIAGLLALLPVWRLHRAGWPTGSLLTAWLLYSLGIFVGMRFPGPFRLLLPIIIVAYVAPFVAGPERLARVLRGRQPDRGVIIDVTPRPAPGLPEPPPPATPRGVTPDESAGPASSPAVTPDEPGTGDDPGMDR
jgi:hypothetical protein